MHIKHLIQTLAVHKISFFTGVPDSQLSPLCTYLYNTHNISNTHIVAANEGNAAAIAAGYHLATGKVPCVYLQNSGEGNIINPVTSLLNPHVYGIPCLFIIGWRGEPGIHDEPQHIFQGQITLPLLDTLNLTYKVIDKNTTPEELQENFENFEEKLTEGNSVALVIKKGAFTYEEPFTYQNEHTLIREDIIREITKVSEEDIIISTTGKTSRELFEIREAMQQSHKYDFLTVGSMGHSSSIALGVALYKPHTRVWCIDGDGAALMHMGAMAVIGAQKPANLIHIVINNVSHESVGGMPTVADKIDLPLIAEACGYEQIHTINSMEQLLLILPEIKAKNRLTFIEIKAKIGSRADLGRPTLTAQENKENFMNYLKELN